MTSSNHGLSSASSRSWEHPNNRLKMRIFKKNFFLMFNPVNIACVDFCSIEIHCRLDTNCIIIDFARSLMFSSIILEYWVRILDSFINLKLSLHLSFHWHQRTSCDYGFLRTARLDNRLQRSLKYEFGPQENLNHVFVSFRKICQNNYMEKITFDLYEGFIVHSNLRFHSVSCMDETGLKLACEDRLL